MESNNEQRESEELMRRTEEQQKNLKAKIDALSPGERAEFERLWKVNEPARELYEEIIQANRSGSISAEEAHRRLDIAEDIPLILNKGGEE